MSNNIKADSIQRDMAGYAEGAKLASALCSIGMGGIDSLGDVLAGRRNKKWRKHWQGEIKRIHGQYCLCGLCHP